MHPHMAFHATEMTVLLTNTSFKTELYVLTGFCQAFRMAVLMAPIPLSMHVSLQKGNLSYFIAFPDDANVMPGRLYYMQ